jgi:hypothetical protein
MVRESFGSLAGGFADFGFRRSACLDIVFVPFSDDNVLTPTRWPRVIIARQTASAPLSRSRWGRDRKQGSSSFLKKRTKKLFCYETTTIVGAPGLRMVAFWQLLCQPTTCGYITSIALNPGAH